MSTLRNILLVLSLIYAAVSIWLIGTDNVAGFLLLFLLIVLTFFLLFVKDSFTFVGIVICLIPILGLFIDRLVIKSLVLIIPFMVLFNFKHVINGCRILLRERDIIFYGLCLMVVGVLVSLMSAFSKGVLDVQMMTQVGVLIYESVLLVVFVSLLDDRDTFPKMIYMMLVPAVVLIAMVIVYSVSANIAAIMYSAKGKNLHFGDITIHANLVAMIFTPLIILTMPVILGKKNRINSAMYYITFAFSIVALILTNSRGAWVGFFCAMGYIFLRLKKSKYLWTLLSIVLVICVVLGGVVISRYSQTNKNDMSILERFVIWNAAVKYIVSSPLVGLGPNYFRIAKYKLGVSATVGPINAYSTHNIFLEIAVNYGCLCLVGFLFVMFRCVIDIGRKFKTSAGTSDDDYFLLSVNAAIIAVLVHGIFDCNIANISFATILVFLIGFAIVLARRPLTLSGI